jgi:hypothetical protein
VLKFPNEILEVLLNSFFVNGTNPELQRRLFGTIFLGGGVACRAPSWLNSALLLQALGFLSFCGLIWYFYLRFLERAAS